MPKILLVDDHPLFRDGFAHLARVLRPAWTLYFADDAEKAISIVNETSLDLVIVDAILPDPDGFALVQAIHRISGTLPQIMISGRSDPVIRMRAEACGVRSFIAKTEPPDAIARTIDSVLAGNIEFDTGERNSELPVLTPRQLEVLMLLAKGYSNREIRHHLGIAERTVRAHLTELFLILNTHSRMQALVRARELGLVP